MRLFTNVDGCEEQPEAAFKVNAVGAANLAQAAEKIGARLIHVSTDYVFSGAANGGRPLDEKGAARAHQRVRQDQGPGRGICAGFLPPLFYRAHRLAVRRGGQNFVKTMVAAGKKFGKLEVVNDQLGNPTNAEDLAHHLLKLAVSHDYGVYHCTGEGVCSWYDFAAEIIRLAGVDAQVTPPAPARNTRQSTRRRPAARPGRRWKTGCWPAPWATGCAPGARPWPITLPTGSRRNERGGPAFTKDREV